MTRVPFPHVASSTWTVTRPHTAPGMFAERCLQASRLVELPDLGTGDLTADERRQALRRMINVVQPLPALSLFLGVVALEDFVRDFGARCADDSTLQNLYPQVTTLSPLPVAPNPNRPFARLDRDPTPLADYGAVNQRYLSIFNVQPFGDPYLPKLYDLALIRHTVAHHAARVRSIDAPRFQHWIVQPEQLINPPHEFVLTTTRFLHQVGSAFEVSLRNAVFGSLLPTLAGDWRTHPPATLVSLIELFNYCGKLLEAEPGVVPTPHDAAAGQARAKQRLLELCIAELSGAFPFPVPVPDAG